MTEYNFQIDSAAVSDRGLSEKRPHNEDSFLMIADRGIFAVADGVGGAQAGEVASQMAMEIVGEAFAHSKANSDAEEVMKDAIEHANASIYQTSRDIPQLSTMATTIVGLHISGNIATIAHVGDSRLYRLDGNGNLFRETQDHSVIEEEVRAGRMTPAQAATHPSRNIISRALGAEPTVEIDMKTIMFEPQTTFLLCSDGVTRHIDDFEIRQLLMTDENADKICSEIKTICYERGAEDNLTAIVIRVAKAVAPLSAAQAMPFSTAGGESDPLSVSQTADFSDEDGILEIDELEIPTQSLKMPFPIDESKFPTDEHRIESASAEIGETNQSQEKLTNVKEEVSTIETEVSETAPSSLALESESEILADIEKQRAEGEFLSKLFTGVFCLLLGAFLGAAITYYFSGRNNKTEVIPAMPVNVNQADTEITIFEKSRRTADENAAKFIEAHKDKPEKNALDYYLLGRSYLLLFKFSEAKENFEKAQSQLKDAPEHTRKTLENDIRLGLVISGNLLAAERFKESSIQK